MQMKRLVLQPSVRVLITNPLILMLSNSQINRIAVKNERMSSSRKSVPPDELQREWKEIQAAQQDPRRFRPLYNRYYEPVFRFVLRRTADEALTADLCSQVFLKALQRLKEYEYRGVPFSAWLFRIAANEVAQYYRQNRKQRVVSVEEGDLYNMMEDAAPIKDERQIQNMIAALDELKENDLQLIELRFFEGRPFKEIAAILNITESNAKVKTYRILERLKAKVIARTQ